MTSPTRGVHATRRRPPYVSHGKQRGPVDRDALEPLDSQGHCSRFPPYPSGDTKACEHPTW
jgi:hypothetical protein